MNNEELVLFLKSTLVKIENMINLLSQPVPKHIPAYHKSLGVQQKFVGLDGDLKSQLFPQIVASRSIIHFLLNGHYTDAMERILKLKKDMVNICSQLENEKNRDK